MRVTRLSTLLLLTLWASACTMVGTSPVLPVGPGDSGAAGRPEAPDPDLQVFGGKVTLGGQDLSLVLELRVAELPYRHATLLVPDLPLEARGGGTIEAERMTLDLSYGDDCKGAARLEGRMEADGRRVRGTLQASDCTGSAVGNVILLLRPPGTATAVGTTPLR